MKERGSVYLPQLNAVYVRQFQMMSAAEEAARFLHHACRGLPNRINGRVPEPLAPEDAFYAAVLENAIGYFGSRVLYPARPAFRDPDLHELYDLTREDLELQTALPFRDAVEAIDFLALHRKSGRIGGRLETPPEWQTRAFAFSGRKHEYVTEQLGYLAGNDLYDAYLDGRLTPAGLRKLFLAHIEEPGVARETYFHLNTRLR